MTAVLDFVEDPVSRYTGGSGRMRGKTILISTYAKKMDHSRIPSHTGPMPIPDPESVTISMPTLEDMNQGNEVSRLQTELSQVERQNNLELEMAELTKTESSIGSPRHKERRPGRLLPQFQKVDEAIQIRCHQS